MNCRSISFSNFLFKDQWNKKALCIWAVTIILQFSFFKYLYPYASFIHNDSYVYLYTGFRNLGINQYMIGYAKFLRLVSVFSNSDTVLVGIQYLLIQTSSLVFLFTLFYFNRTGKLIQIISLSFIALNPLYLYLANLVSSDALFLALSLTWFTLLLWIIYKPNNNLIIWQGLVLFIVFTVRYNALIYPFLTLLAFSLSILSIRKKLIGIGIGTCLCGIFIVYTGTKYKELTGSWQYSPFSGWQLANNAMYAYRYVDSADRKPVPAKFKALDIMIREYFDSSRDLKKNPHEALLANTQYMWSRGLPLQKYMDRQFIKDSSADELKKWASMGPFYADYGIYIIKHYPLYFTKYFLWPNANKYYAPPIEYLEPYNMGSDYVAPMAQEWFGYKSLKVSSRMKNFKGSILAFYPILTGIMNMVFLYGLICFALLNGLQKNKTFQKGLILGASTWLFNAGFSIFASSVALRFQAFPIMLMTVFALLLLDWLLNEKAKMKSESGRRGYDDQKSAIPYNQSIF